MCAMLAKFPVNETISPISFHSTRYHEIHRDSKKMKNNNQKLNELNPINAWTNGGNISIFIHQHIGRSRIYKNTQAEKQTQS